jgi:hypothetical protein
VSKPIRVGRTVQITFDPATFKVSSTVCFQAASSSSMAIAPLPCKWSQHTCEVSISFYQLQGITFQRHQPPIQKLLISSDVSTTACAHIHSLMICPDTDLWGRRRD